jgi:peptide/nickel transport system substrate-binding protein
LKNKLFRLASIGFLIVLVVFSSGIARSASRDVVKVGLGFDPATVNMFEFKVGWDLPVILGMHESLMFTHPETGKRLKSGLAKSVRIINGKDLKFKLYKFAKFHTGDPVTAHDVKFTYEQCANPRNRNIMAGRLMDIKSIDVLDDYTLIFRYYEPDAAWREIMWIGICSKKYYERVGRVKFSKHPVGSGPLRFVSRKIGHSVTQEIVPNHHSKKYGLKWYRAPEIKMVKFIIVTDDVARIAMLETGEVDLISDILPHHLKRLRRNKHIKIKRTAPASLFALSFKPDNFPILKDSKLALAFTYGINRKEIIDKIYLGEGYPLYMFASRTEFGYDPRIVYKFDPARARRLVKQSSYKSGMPLILTYTNAIPNAALVAQSVQKYMKDVGVTIKLQQLEAGIQATYSRNRDKREGHMTLYRWDGGRDIGTRLMLTIPSTSIYNAWKTRKYKNELNKLCQAQAREMNRRRRLAIIRRITSLLTKEPSGPILFGLNMNYAMRDWMDYNWLPGEPFIYYVARTRVLK